MYNRMRGTLFDIIGCSSLKALKAVEVQEEQTNKSQVLHGGQEQLRRNIKVTMHEGPGNRESMAEALRCHRAERE